MPKRLNGFPTLAWPRVLPRRRSSRRSYVDFSKARFLKFFALDEDNFPELMPISIYRGPFFRPTFGQACHQKAKADSFRESTLSVPATRFAAILKNTQTPNTLDTHTEIEIGECLCMKGSLEKRAALLDEMSGYFLRQLVDLGGYCTALQAEALGIAETAKRVRARLRMLERLGFLRRVTKYPVVYQVTKSATRLHGPDSSTRRRHMPPTVQARLLGVHFYLEARNWPATFFFDHEEKIMTLQNAQCPLTLLPQRKGKPYVREHLVFLFADMRLGVAMIDLLQPGMMSRLRVFVRQYLPLLRHLRDDVDLLIVTADKRRAFTYQRLLRTTRTIHKLGLGALTTRIKPYSVKPPVPTIDEITWPTADTDDLPPEMDEDRNNFRDTAHKYARQPIGE